jgi:hypothetical protein
VERLVDTGVNVFIVGTIVATNCVLEALQNKHYTVSSMKSDVFTARKGRGKQVKVIFTSFSKQQLLENFPE